VPLGSATFILEREAGGARKGINGGAIIVGNTRMKHLTVKIQNNPGLRGNNAKIMSIMTGYKWISHTHKMGRFVIFLLFEC